MQQLPLDLVAIDAFSRDRFVESGSVRPVLDALLHPNTWLAPHLLITGPEGSGKTHLGHIFAKTHGAVFVGSADSAALQIAPGQSYVIDDADSASEETLFHLFNTVQASGGYLVLLSRVHPLQWAVTLPDWQSRLRAMRLVTLPEPDDDLLEAILSTLFAQRAISPSTDAVAYIASRADRSVAALQKIVTELEHYANGRAFTRGLARDFFEHSQTLPFDETESDSR
ncbi:MULTISPECIES: DnaA ATPase domain-containing protein [Asticcacaulis]|uniref:DnaA ATPase domain-containing protein n=1 Tax=Asticcacaulis TaxID=76890 RepID=UPI001AE39AC5|nr:MULTISPECIES: DnaA/Hda family protein [Asticcacaulis]MBP2158148.1 chromosomal replication initiation ATPase DnaA [Asticcacaulis solisilvae]MDR6799193.1 chromosomal replication initiation ATPase DnaA [Asticcacaulis sp. BE141]